MRRLGGSYPFTNATTSHPRLLSSCCKVVMTHTTDLLTLHCGVEVPISLDCTSSASCECLTQPGRAGGERYQAGEDLLPTLQNRIKVSVFSLVLNFSPHPFLSFALGLTEFSNGSILWTLNTS